MRSDYSNWEPLSVMEIVHIFNDIPAQWYIAGGWALDLYLGQQSREHSDIDITILREEQTIVYEKLSSEWTLYKAHHGKLSLWEKGEHLDIVGDVWVSRDCKSPFAFQLMLVDTEQEQWIYKRQPAIRRPLDDILLTTASGVPYLKPEIQLLYKGGGSQVRPKDEQDLMTVLPILNEQAKEWLRYALNEQFPEGHPWVTQINNSG
ncbi:hypothetical protein JCM10914A_12450 [Paenibacillus sp. JCM 10914]|nr:hypothetical protein [Paenibacillus sp. JCM 10914]